MGLDRSCRVVERRHGAGHGRGRVAIPVGHDHLAIHEWDEADDEFLAGPGGRGVHQLGRREAGQHRRPEPRDERQVRRGVLVEHRLEVEVGAVRLAGRHQVQGLSDECGLRCRAGEEGPHLGEAAGVEQLERRDDPHALVVGSVGDGRHVVADVVDVARLRRVKRSVRLDPDAEDRDRRDEFVLEPIDRRGIDAPVREVAVDLLAERGDAGDPRPDDGRGADGGAVGHEPGGEDGGQGQHEREGGLDQPSGAAEGRSHRLRKPRYADSVQSYLGPVARDS